MQEAGAYRLFSVGRWATRGLDLVCSNATRRDSPSTRIERQHNSSGSKQGTSRHACSVRERTELPHRVARRQRRGARTTHPTIMRASSTIRAHEVSSIQCDEFATQTQWVFESVVVKNPRASWTGILRAVTLAMRVSLQLTSNACVWSYFLALVSCDAAVGVTRELFMNRALITFLAATILAACTGNSSAPPMSFIASDAGEPDAAPDAQGHADAGKDAGKEPVDDPIYPTWDPLVEKPVGCTAERMRTTPTRSAFTWTPCEGQAGCEQMSLAPWLSDDTKTFSNAALYSQHMYATPNDAYVTLTLIASPWPMTLIVRQDGTVIDGFRVARDDSTYLIRGSSIWDDHYGVLISKKLSANNFDYGGFLVSTKAPSTLKTFEYKPYPAGVSATFIPMARSRWLWTTSCKYVSVSAFDGLDLQTAAICGSSVLQLSYPPTQTGTRFIFAETWTPDNIQVKSRISYTDGVAPPTPFIVSPDDAFYEDPTYAHSHIAWTRGIGPKGPGLFDTVEIWASKYSDDPNEIVPYKVGDYGLNTSLVYWRAGGFGRLAVLSGADAPIYNEFVIWDLAEKTKRTFTVPEGRRIALFIGMTSTHLWVATRSQPDMPIDGIYRFQVTP